MGKTRLLKRVATRASKTLLWTSVSAAIITHFVYHSVYCKKKYEQY